MSLLCNKPHPNHPEIRCGRDVQHLEEGRGPCAKQVVLEWHINKEGRVYRSAIVNGRVDNLEDRYQGTVIQHDPAEDNEITPLAILTPPKDEG